MSFRRTNNYNMKARVSSAFADMLTQIADATTNLTDELKFTANFIGLNQNTLGELMLSSNPEHREIIQRFRNLSISLQNHDTNNLPEQFNQQIFMLRQSIIDNPVDVNFLSNLFIRTNVPLNYNIHIDNNIEDNNLPIADNNLPIIDVAHENIKKDICTICLLDLDENIVALQCQHQFHRDCIMCALQYKNSCPLCRFDIV